MPGVRKSGLAANASAANVHKVTCLVAMEAKRKNEQGSNFLSRTLRHQPELAGLKMEPGGRVMVTDLIRGLKKAGHHTVASGTRDISYYGAAALALLPWASAAYSGISALPIAISGGDR